MICQAHDEEPLQGQGGEGERGAEPLQGEEDQGGEESLQVGHSILEPGVPTVVLPSCRPSYISFSVPGPLVRIEKSGPINNALKL